VLTLDEVKPGLALGRYECLMPIARGGMAAVWAARARGARGFQRFVAIKIMLPTLSSDPDFETMFLDEARIVSRIRHPHVVEIIDLGEQDSLLYIVMEWIDGEPLNTLMRKASQDGHLPMGIAARIMADTCTGLHAAHELKDDNGRVVGLVHRDISPQNVMVGYDGITKLLDFGVAKAVGVSSAETAAGHIKGKVAYMAPEQVTGDRVDRRTDVFASGIVLYQMVTGKHPFRADHEAGTIHNVLSREVPPPRQFVPDCPPRMHQVLMRALQRDPERRFQSAAEMGNELDEIARLDGKRVNAEMVGAFVRSVAGVTGDERRAALKKAVTDADVRVPVGAGSLAEAADRTGTTPAAGSELSAKAPSGDTEQSAVALSGATALPAVASPAAARGGRLPWVFFGVSAVIAAAVVVVIAVRSSSQPPASVASSATVNAPASVAAASTPPDASAAASAAPVQSEAAAPSVPQPAASGKRSTGKAPGKAAPGGWVPPLSDPGF
jgi:eukaryotic-like serine/threonine-protein kinase